MRVLKSFQSLSADEVGRRILDLHQRHAQEVSNVLEAGVERHRAELVKGTLPPSSVLLMTIARGTAAAAVARSEKTVSPVETWLDEVETEGASLDEPIDEQVPQQSSQRKHRPTFERAKGIIEEIYPDGPPDQATEPNAVLCRRVSDKLKAAGLRSVSDDTILRAAGRRKDRK
jgi:hypothetical protein